MLPNDLAPWIALLVAISTVLFSIMNARYRKHELLQRDQEIGLKADEHYVRQLKERIELLEEEKHECVEKLQALQRAVDEQQREIARLWRLVIQGPSPQGHPSPPG